MVPPAGANRPRGWHIRRLQVCASTERELDRWLALAPPQPSCLRRLVIARRQRYGHGQRGRPWISPAGGLWLSAAFPWPQRFEQGAALPLALALALAEEIGALGVPVAIKWPNDLLVEGRKLAGLLPRLRWRGSRLLWARLGLGINGINRVPEGAISLAEALAGRGFHPQATPARLEKLALRALERAIGMAGDAELVRVGAERRLWRSPSGLLHAGRHWQVLGLEADGALRLLCQGEQVLLRRDF